MRTHTDLDDASLEGVLEARAGAGIEVEIVAFVGAAVDPTRAEGEARLRETMAAGADVVGGAPAFHAEPTRALKRLVALAADLGRPLDLHLDEHLEPEKSLAVRAIELVGAHGMGGRATLSHLSVLSVMEDRGRLVERIAAAGITVVSLPATNLYHQDRGGVRRGLAPLAELLAAGVRVRLASDNIRDPFYPFGDADPLEAAWLGAVAGHIEDSRAPRSDSSRRPSAFVSSASPTICARMTTAAGCSRTRASCSSPPPPSGA